MAKAPEPQTIPHTTIGGFAIGIVGFIPIPADDLKAQAAIPTLLLDIQEGRKTMAELIPMMKQVELRQSFTRKRVPKAEAAEWSAQGDMLETGDSEEETDPPGDDD